MANMEPTIAASREERLFQEYTKRAEDFLKIEMYRPALKWFTEARQFGFETDYINQKIAGCKADIRKESRIISIIAFVAVAIIAIAFIATQA
jgi:hypothetical protein